MNKYKTQTFDLLIIGGGGSGLRAAIEAAKQGVKLAIISKETFGHAHTEKAMGGLNVAIKAPATPQQHYSDTIKGGWNINNHTMVRIFSEEMPERIHDLVSYGVKFDMLPDGTFYTWAGGKQSAPLNLCAGDYTGREMMQGLAAEVKKLKIPFFEEYFVTKIFANKKGVSGVLAFNRRDGTFTFFQTKAVVVAVGGAGQIYKITSNEPSNTGEGYAWAFDCGVNLADMEFIQFHPTGMAFPESVRGSLITEKVRGHKGKLYNTQGERFMLRYQPERKELAGRDEVARAIYTEIQEGRGTKHGAVYLDVRELGLTDIKKLIPDVYQKFMDVGVDISKEKMEISPTMHHVMGGIKINEWGESTLPGFFGTGEVTTSIHGANRLGGNSLAEGQVFGRRTGMRAAEYAKKAKQIAVSQAEIEAEIARIESIKQRKNGVSYTTLQKQLKKTMWDNVGIVRNEQSLLKAQKDIEDLRNEAEMIGATKKSLQSTLETIEMIKVARLIIASALMRKESRGAHFRSDYPQKDAAWEKNIIVKNVNGTIKTEVVPVIKE